jgi:hypothetical protein
MDNGKRIDGVTRRAKRPGLVFGAKQVDEQSKEAEQAKEADTEHEGSVEAAVLSGELAVFDFEGLVGGEGEQR